MTMPLAERIAEVRARVERAARGRSVTIVAVSKRHDAAAVREAWAAGLRDFGENYAQELVKKREELADLGASGLRWHYIGRLQRNKAKYLAGRVALIHAVDSVELAREIDRRADGAVQAVLIAVNVAGEESKGGVASGDVEALLDAIDGLERVRCDGFMTMAPWPETPEQNRAVYAELRKLRERLARPGRELAELSMGTTGDYEVAIAEGATLVRVGTAIFGERPV